MCGITGIISGTPVQEGVIQAMTAAIAHRGPDGAATWSGKDKCVALGHQRLAVVDLSEAGGQPMHSSDGRYCIVYNGEIYNAGEIRLELQQGGKTFRGTSDTEVLLEACATLGLKRTLTRITGMFAFALWDRRESILYLVRDRLGIKPLYWGHFGNLFIFGSELKALRKHPGWSVDIDPNAVAAFMQYGYVPTPLSIYRGINKLKPGSMLVYRQGSEPEVSQYWSVEAAINNGVTSPLSGSVEELTASTETILDDAVRSRMLADVPLGAFLSGGIDSSTVVALMQKNSNRPVKTFSIGFHEEGYNEAGFARGVAEHLGTEHTEFYVTAADALDVIPGLAEIYDEPFADSSQIPTCLVSELTRRHVTVALSGDGGDEVFAGYNRYQLADNLMHRLRLLTPAGRYMLMKLIHALPPRQWSGIFSILPERFRVPQAGDKLYKLADVMACHKKDIYNRLVSHWTLSDRLLCPDVSGSGLNTGAEFPLQLDSMVAKMQYQDMLTYLPDDILAKVDRASMAVSLEVRVPLLDHRLVEHAWRLPGDFKLRNGQGKWVLRQILNKYVPEQLTNRPKMGFGIPLDNWLRAPLKGWAESLLDRTTLTQQGLINADVIHDIWQQHLSGERNWQYRIWNVLVFQAWYQRWMQ